MLKLYPEVSINLVDLWKSFSKVEEHRGSCQGELSPKEDKGGYSSQRTRVQNQSQAEFHDADRIFFAYLTSYISKLELHDFVP